MLLETWGETLTASFQRMWDGIISYVPNIIIAIIIFLVGWFIGAMLGRLVAQIIRSLKVDNLFRSLGTEEVLMRAGFKLDVGAFVGALVKWFVILAFLVAAVDALNLDQVTIFLTSILAYLPNVIVAALILIVAAFVADVLQRLVIGSAKAAGVVSANFMGGIAKWAIWIFAILAALSQLGIATDLIRTLFWGLVGMLALAGGLAFGLGGRDAAARYIERLRRDITSE